LHDTRIAAKRLRYVLEMHTPVFGQQAARAAKEARKLQDLLGAIHDCDELLPIVRGHVRRMRAEDAAAVRARAGARAKELDPRLYTNRELSWLDFNDRVLQLAEDESMPLLERVKFLAIYCSNLDEFFMVRVAGVHDQVDAGIDVRGRDGLAPTETIDRIAERV